LTHHPDRCRSVEWPGGGDDVVFIIAQLGQGDQAMTAWWEVINNNMPDDQIEMSKEALLKYCELDTWAMVEILKCLHKKFKRPFITNPIQFFFIA
jgi:cobalamin biosynthesis protein CbiG